MSVRRLELVGFRSYESLILVLEDGPHVIVGAGTLVPMGKQVPSGVLIVGAPFRVVRELTDDDLAWIDESWRSYTERTKRFRARDGL